MARFVSSDSRRGFLSVFWEQFNSMDLISKMFLVVIILIVGVTPYIIHNYQTLSQNAATLPAGCYYQPVPCSKTCGKGLGCVKKCPPPVLVCPSPTPIISPSVAPSPIIYYCSANSACPSGYVCSCNTVVLGTSCQCLPSSGGGSINISPTP